MKNKVKVLYTSNLSRKEELEFKTEKIELDVRPFIKVNSTFDKVKLKEFANNYKPQAIILTSQKALNGLFALSEMNFNDLSVLALSKKIADQINEEFSSVIISEESNVDSVADAAIKQFSNKRILHLNGNLRRNELKDHLLQKNMTIENYQVYETELIQPEVDLSEYDAVGFLSYSGIDSFFSKYELNEGIITFTIGANTSDYLRNYFNGQVFTSSDASISTLLKEIKEYFSND